tara:strand:+ start:50199 stop:51035 length:837 start_codon:yes stop_codon:yes gene_type:complete
MSNVLELTAYKNGEYMPLKDIGPSILDFGFIHCDATYDVMPVYNGNAFCFDRHENRFRNSAKRYGLKIPDVNFLEICKTLKSKNEIKDAFVWFILWRGFPPSGNPRDLENCPVNFAMYMKPSYPIASTPMVKLYLDKHVKRVHDAYYGQTFKNMAWIELTMSQIQRPKDFDTTVLVDTSGNVTEGPGFNVGIVKDKRIMTASANVLRGVTMTVVEDIAKECNLEFNRTPISIELFESADEVFITSSSGGVTATTKTGSITDLLIDKYEQKKEEYATEL